METNWDLYKYFYFVCEFKNITRVAEYFCVTQPAITKKIHQMLKPIFESFSNIETEFIKQSNSNKITIKLAVGYWPLKNVIIPAIARFNIEHPNVDFYTITCSFEDSMKKLKSGEVDVVYYLR